MRFDRLEVDGSLRVEASAPLGRMEEGELRYSDECGRIRMEGCRVINQGIDRDDPGNVFWRQR